MVLKHILNFFSDILLQHIAYTRPFRMLAGFLNANFSPRKDVIVRIGKHKMYANTLDRVFALYLWKASVLEDFETDLIKKSIKKGMTVIDVGANIGYYTLIFADLAGKKGKVYAFEPDSSNHRLLSKNIDANNYKNVVAVKKAVSDKQGKIKFYLSEEHRGDHRSYDPGGKRKKIEVECTALDKFMKGKTPDVIKIDVQGAEFRVLKGMTNILRKNRNITVFCEFFPGAMRTCGDSPEKFLEFLEKNGFDMRIINEKRMKIEAIEPSALIRMCGGNGYVNLFLKR